jgi:hypothetical protein
MSTSTAAIAVTKEEGFILLLTRSLLATIS